MNIRTISLAAALLLGYVSAQSPTYYVDTQDSIAQSTFVEKSTAQVAKWDKDSKVKAVGCNLYDDFAFFNLQPIAGPYYVRHYNRYSYFQDSKETYTDYEVRFCNPVYQTGSQDKASLIYLRQESETEDKKRSLRLTSGDNTMNYTKTLRKVTNESDGDEIVYGISYNTRVTSDDKVKKCNNQTWKTNYQVLCSANKNRSAPLQASDLVFSIDKNTCTINISATHAAGCPTLEFSGFVQYLADHPWIIAGILFAFGITSCFFGGLLFDWVVASLAGIMTFLVVALICNAIGGFKAIESGSVASAGRVVVTILCFLLSIGAGVAAGWFVKKTNKIALGVLGGVGGFFLAFLFYGLVFAKFVTQSQWLLWVIISLGVIVGSFLVFRFKEVIVVGLTAAVGAYMAMRGISLVAGGYPGEFVMFSQMSSGDFDLPNTFYAYLAGIVALTIGGIFFQRYRGYHKNAQVSSSSLEEKLITV